MALLRATKKELQAACPDIELGDKLGEGGNAQVYEGTCPVHGAVAVKFMLNDNTKRFGRFRDEVLVVTTRLKDSPRVVPILKRYLPPEPSKTDIPWYVMPRADKVKALRTEAPWQEQLVGLIDLAQGLAEIHKQDVAHRDIKPANLLELEGTPRFADFGIAAFPEKSGLTEKHEPMGPSAGFMAPEMLTDSEHADPMKADVYSFAKTVWAVLTSRGKAFIGHYVADSPYGLGKIAAAKLMGFITEPLDALLDRSTDPNPERRPSAQEFADSLQKVAEVQEDWDQANILQWAAAEDTVLHTPGLTRAIWEGPANIAQVLDTLSRRRGLNHLFFPEYGGQALTGATTCEGESLLLLRLGEIGAVAAKPRRLTLERFPDAPAVSYALLETEDIPPLGVGPRYSDGEREHLRRVSDFDYVVDDSDDYEPKNNGVGVPCDRHFKGGLFVLAPTRGLYNAVDDYDGTATKLGREKLRARFEAHLAHIRSPGPEFQLRRMVRLLREVEGFDATFKLQHLTMDHLEQLLDLDEALLAERAEGATGLILSLSELHKAAMAEPSASDTAAKKLIRGLTAGQRGEYLALVYVGRGTCKPSDFASEAAKNAKDVDDDAYLLEKLGNGYMRKVLARFGLVLQRGDKEIKA